MVHPVWYIVSLGVAIGTVLFAYYNTAKPQEYGRNRNQYYPEFPPDDGDSQRSTCSICLNTMPNSLMTELGCGHSFHKRCIDKWFETSARLPHTCPNCRMRI